MLTAALMLQVRQPASGGWSAPLEPGFSARGAALVDQLQAIAGQFTNRLFARQIANSLWALSATPQLHAPSTRAFLRTLTRELAAEEYQKLFQVSVRGCSKCKMKSNAATSERHAFDCVMLAAFLAPAQLVLVCRVSPLQESYY